MLKQILDLEMRDTGECHQKILQLCRDVIKYSVKTSRNGILSTVVLHANLERRGDVYKALSPFRELGV